ncbi:class I SAM-dependent methyltransferase [bacterium]|nr:class I SAM-dependent methyltransferase [bacterium]
MVKNKIIRQFIPPILYRKNIWKRGIACFLLRLYGLLRGKNKGCLFYGELLKQLEKFPELSILFPEEKIKKHYVYEPMRDSQDNPDLYLTQIRFYQVYRYLKKYYPVIFDAQTSVLDVGATSGVLLEACGKKGTGVNMNKECVVFMKRKGIQAVRGNAEDLKFEDSSFDFVFCFQTFEHCPNPIKVLNELGRVARKKVFLSIPYRNTTQLYNIKYWMDLKRRSWKEEDVKNVDCHIFEFSTDDFKNILSHTNLKYETNFPINYFDNNSFANKLLNLCYGSYFNFFVLSPNMLNDL